MNNLNGVKVSRDDLEKIERCDDRGETFVMLLSDRASKNDASGCDSIVLYARARDREENKQAELMKKQGMTGKVGDEA